MAEPKPVFETNPRVFQEQSKLTGMSMHSGTDECVVLSVWWISLATPCIDSSTADFTTSSILLRYCGGISSRGAGML